MTAMFRSLSTVNYRIWAAGAIVSNTGTWMQRTAQDWLVLTILTDNDAVAMGFVMALQFGPPIVLLPITGLVADRFPLRKILMVTQASMGMLGLLLGLLTVSGLVQLWQVYIFAALLGCTAAFDAPARQTFVSELVEGPNLINAVSLNSASFNLARMFGPAIAGFLTAIVGAGWVFLINAATFAAVLVSLKLIRVNRLFPMKRAARARGDLVGGFKYVRKRPDILVVLVMVFLVGTFGFNFSIYTATMARIAFDKDATAFGLLSSVMAIGSVAGALLSARRERPRMSILLFAVTVFGAGCAIAAVMPDYLLFALSLLIMGLGAQSFSTTANSSVQLSSAPHVRGRVMAIYMAIFMGGKPLGAPLVGWVANAFGPRWSLVIGAASGAVSLVVGLGYLVKFRNLRVRYASRRVRLTLSDRAEIRDELAEGEAQAERG